VLEREIREMAFVPRWSIVRTNRQQFLAEHTFFVAMYANDLAVWLDIEPFYMGALLQMALWHDMEEVFSGDIPGPCKRGGLNSAARMQWDERLRGWLWRLFPRLDERDGSNHFPLSRERYEQFSAIIKLADYIDECCEMGTEIQMGNSNVELVFRDSLSRVKNAVREVVRLSPHVGELHEDEVPFDGQSKADELMQLCLVACFSSKDGVSRNTSVFDTL
jgi:5'-deoxynucleotidase YfbR-like HD superfamily hydrolase